MKKLAALILVVGFVISGFVFAEAEEEQSRETPQVRQNGSRTSPVGRVGMRGDRKQMMREWMEKQRTEHEAALKELKDIKKIAEEEEAVKTAEAIQKLIDKKDAEFKKKIEQMQLARQAREKKMREGMKKDKPQIDMQKEKMVQKETEEK